MTGLQSFAIGEPQTEWNGSERKEPSHRHRLIMSRSKQDTRTNACSQQMQIKINIYIQFRQTSERQLAKGKLCVKSGGSGSGSRSRSGSRIVSVRRIFVNLKQQTETEPQTEPKPEPKPEPHGKKMYSCSERHPGITNLWHSGFPKTATFKGHLFALVGARPFNHL